MKSSPGKKLESLSGSQGASGPGSIAPLDSPQSNRLSRDAAPLKPVSPDGLSKLNPISSAPRQSLSGKSDPLDPIASIAPAGKSSVSALPSISADAPLSGTSKLDASLIIQKTDAPSDENDKRSTNSSNSASDGAGSGATAERRTQDRSTSSKERASSPEGAPEYEDEFDRMEYDNNRDDVTESKVDDKKDFEVTRASSDPIIEPKLDADALLDTKREVDSALYSRILMMRPRGPAEDLLHAAISDQDVIGLQMMLSELGEDAPLEILRQDSLGRNCIHLAAMYPTAASLDMLSALLGCLPAHAEALLKRDLQHLSKQYDSAMDNIRKTSSVVSTDDDSDVIALLLSDDAKSAKDRVAALQLWYEEEQQRIKRRTEFHIEMWRLRALGSRDCDGRSPIHYAAINGSKLQLSVMLSKKHRGRFIARDILSAKPSDEAQKNKHLTSNAKRKMKVSEGEAEKDLMLRHVVYNTLTGEEVGKIGSADSSHGSGKRGIAWGKSTTTAVSSSMGPESAENMKTKRVLDAVESSEAFLDNEIIVPWVLRNMLRRASDLSRHMNVMPAKGYKDEEETPKTTGIEVLKELLDEAVESEKNYVRAADPDEPIYLSSDGFKGVLGRLGITLTTEVLQEVVSRYLFYGKVETAISEFDLDNEDLELFFDDIADGKSRTSDSIIQRSHKTDSYSSKDGSKDQSRSRNQSLSVQSLRKSNEFGRDQAESKDGARSDSDAKGLSKTDQPDKALDPRFISDEKRRRQLLKASNAKVASELKRLALTQYINVDLLMVDIKTGKGLTSLDLKTLGVGTSTLNNQPRQKLLEAIGSEPPSKSHFAATLGPEDEGFYEPTADITSTKIDHDAADGIVIPAVLSLSKITELRRRLVNIRDSNSCTPLHLAAAEGSRDTITLLIDEGADITMPFTIAPVVTDPYDTFAATNKTSLAGQREARTYTAMAVARNPNVKSVLIGSLAKLLLRHRLNLCDEKSNSSLTTTLRGVDEGVDENNRNLDNPELELLSYIAGSDGQKLNFSRPLLSWAVLVASFKTVKQIVTCMRIDVNEKDGGGRTAMHDIAGLASQAVEKSEAYLENSDGSEANSAVTVLENGTLRAMLEVILENGGNPDAPAVTGRTPLHDLFSHSASSPEGAPSSHAKPAAASKKHSGHKFGPTRAVQERKNILRSLLRWGADYSIADRQGFTPLHYCAKEDAVECLQTFLDDFERMSDGKTMGPYSKCLQGRNVLHTACASNSLRCIDLLLRWDADNAITAACEALVSKTKSDAAYTTSLSLERDMRNKMPMQLIGVSIPAERQQTFWESCFFGNKHLVEQSIRVWRAGTGKRGDSFASLPLWEDVGESVTLFGTQNEIMTRTAGSNVGSELYIDDDFNNTKPLMLDTATSIQKCIWTMSGIDSKTRLHGWSPLHCCIIGWACVASTEKKNLCARRVLEKASTHTRSGKTSSQALTRGSKLSNTGGTWGHTAADPKSSRGLRGMCHAKGKVVPVIGGIKVATNPEVQEQFVDADHSNTVLMLLKNRAFINALDAKSRTPLMIAAACNLIDAVSMLIEHGADLSLRDSINGSTALHYAYASGSMATASLLEERGADLSPLDNADRTPIDVTGMLSAIGGGIL